MAPTVNEIEPGVSSALATRRLTADIKNITANVANTKMNTNLAKTSINKAHADTRVQIATDRNLNLERMILVEKALQAKDQTSAIRAKAIAEAQEWNMGSKFLNSKIGKAAWYANKVGGSINPFSSAYRNVR